MCNPFKQYYWKFYEKELIQKFNTTFEVIVDYKINIINIILGPQNGSPFVHRRRYGRDGVR